MSFQRAVEAFSQGQFRPAAEWLESLPPDERQAPQARNLAALIGLECGRAEAAMAELDALCRQFPERLDFQLNRASAELNHGDPGRAASRFQALRQQHPTHPQINLNLGIAQYRSGERAAAEQTLREALRAEPGLIEARCLRIKILAELGEQSACEQALGELAPYQAQLNADDWNLVGLACQEIDYYQFAQQSFENARRINPRHHEATLNLALQLEEQNQPREAQALLDQLGDSADPNRALLQARLHRRHGDYRTALEALAAVDDAPPRQLATIRFLQADLNDRLGEHDQAWGSAAEANHLAREHLRRHNVDQAGDSHRGWLGQRYAPELMRSWRSRGPDADPAPVFLVGMPRSGTTLLQQLLIRHPQVQSLNEKPVLPDLARALNQQLAGTESLENWDEATLRAWQEHYWQGVTRYLNRRSGTLLIDKFPLNLIHAPLIARVFPNARVIEMQRDPRDVCISQFFSDLRTRDPERGYWSIEDCMRLYDEIDAHWQAHAPGLDDALITCDYAALTDDPETTLRSLCAALGLDWDEAILQAETVAPERIGTPSYQDAVRTPDPSRQGRHQHYRAYLPPWRRSA